METLYFTIPRTESLAIGVLNLLEDLKGGTKQSHMKETPFEKMERIRASWKYFKGKIQAETPRITVQSHPIFKVKRIKGIQHGNNRNKVKDLLRKFWVAFERIETDELRLAALISIANQFDGRVADRRLRKLRKKYNRNKHNLLNIPFEKCGTCEKKAQVRHHIIPLCVGGINSPLNLIQICNGCHEEIHPWMKRK